MKGTLGDNRIPSVQKTDYSRWRLLDERGRQTWHYLEDDDDVRTWPQSIADKYHLGLPTVMLLIYESDVRMVAHDRVGTTGPP